MKYNVTLWFADGSTDGTVEFAINENSYGNKHYMKIKFPGCESIYDIRYDRDFHKDEKIQYIVQMLCKIYKLTGISVKEA